jgi:hypothetical protein
LDLLNIRRTTMKIRLIVAACAVGVIAPLGAAHANGPVSFSISTPDFGIRVGAPFYGPVFAPAPVYVPAPAYPLYAPAPVYLPAPVYVPPPRLIYPRPVVVVPRVVYPRSYVPAPRVYAPPYYGRPGQYAGYRVPHGHVIRYTEGGRYQ